MHKNTTKCNKTQSKWCINKHGASKIIDTFETYQRLQWRDTRRSAESYVAAFAASLRRKEATVAEREASATTAVVVAA
jgi:hypothetical protein